MSHKAGFVEKIKIAFFTQKFLLFVLCGGCGTLVNFICSLVFSHYINSTLAYVCGYIVSMFVTYLLNTYIIFKLPLSPARLVKFIISYVPNFLILFTIVAILLNIFNYPKIMVYLVSSVLGLPLTFVLIKNLAFGKKT